MSEKTKSNANEKDKKIIFSAYDKEKIENFDKEGLGEYLFNFDPLKKKYSFLESGLPIGTLEKIHEFEFSQSYSNLTKSKYSHISDNLELVYGNTTITKKDIVTYHEATKKIVHEFLAIQNLDRLFDEDYFDFEWDILAQKNFTEHRQGYQREHFIHQIRNLYMGDKLLNELDFYNATKKVISDKNGSKISKYVYKKYIQFKNDEYSPIAQLIKKILPYIENEILVSGIFRPSKPLKPSKEDVLIVFNKIIDSSKDDGIINSESVITCRDNLAKCNFADENWQTSISEYLGKFPSSEDVFINFKECFQSYFCKHYIFKWYAEEYFYNYVIYASLYLSCLFHDLSYPVCYFLEFRHRLSNYSAASYMFTHNSMDSFDVLANKLSNSLLFTIVSYGEIKKRMEYKDQKYDHGVYSAIAFLLHFYESGLINTLSYEKQCAIELAAVAMYDHTLSFDCEKIEKDNLHYSPYFNQNPIAFILRLCDDLQEWDRRYFEFTGDSDLIFCPKCKTPMLKHQYMDENLSTTKTFTYKCFCGCKGTNPYRPEEFLKRKIFVVRIADRLVAQKISQNIPSSDLTASNETGNKNDPKLIKFTVDYDLYKLLLMSRYSYAKYRLEDLNKLKKKLKYQNYLEQSGVPEAPTAIFIDYFMTSNPITIKIKMLERWLKLKTPMSNFIEIGFPEGNFNDVKMYLGLKEINKEESESSSKEKGKLPEESFFAFVNALFVKEPKKTKENFKRHLWWYYLVLIFAEHYRKNKSKDIDDISYLIKALPFCKPKDNRKFDEYSYQNYTEILVKDCLEQYSKEMEPSENYDDIISFMNEKIYTEQYVSNDEVYDAVMKYCYQETYCKEDQSCFRPDFNDYNFDGLPINYFSDLYIFEKMNEELRLSKEEKEK